MTVREALSRVARIQVPAGSPPAAGSAAAVIAAQTGAAIDEVDALDPAPEAGVFQLEAPAHASRQGALAAARIDLRLRPDGSGRLVSAGGRLLYAAARQLVDVLADDDLGALEQGLSITPSFAWNRSCYDVFLTQEGRIQHGLDVEAYVRQLAAWGYTHVEVNALAYPMGLETGPKGEVYPMFYTYCPALDQFVYSSLNKGLYPFYYLSANLAVLKRNAALARKYGLVPGLLSFEPRSVPEEFFARYPMLRGPRVDHPFRSFRPRFTMTLAHPRVRDHYAEMMTALLREVPDLGFLSVWSNDSGSGFEHTKSLYVGRNGGPYMIREWNDDAEIAKTAGAHVVQFLALLRDAARAVNPEFRVITRLESFYGRARHRLGRPRQRPRRRDDVAHRPGMGDAIPSSPLPRLERHQQRLGVPARVRAARAGTGNGAAREGCRGAPLLLGRPAPDVRAAPRHPLPDADLAPAEAAA